MRNATFADYGVDLRGLGGYVIAPPSTLYDKDGKVIGSYVVKGSSERGSPLIWREIRSLLKPAKHVVPGLSHYSAGSLEAWVRALKEGQRNDGLWWAARTAIEEGRDPWTLADAAQKTGLDIGEITKVIESAQNADGVA
jgi:hypothetical protein